MYRPHITRRRNAIPILRREEIDFHAERFAEDYAPGILQTPQTFDIDGFVEQYLGLTLDYQYLSHNGICLGMTVFNDTSKVPVYNPERNMAEYLQADHGTVIIDSRLTVPEMKHRYRFTLGHECGHWVYHKAYYGYDPGQLCLFEMNEPFVSCREVNSNDMYAHTHYWDDAQWMEWQADQFAAGILMPAASVHSLFPHEMLGESQSDVDHAVRTVSDVYDVSMQAAYLRLYHLGIIDWTVSDEQYEQLSFL